MALTFEDIKDGDLIKILGEEPDEDTYPTEYKEVYWYGEKVGVTEPDTDGERLLEVYIIQEPPEEVVIEEGDYPRRVAWTYEVPEAIHHIPIESVVYHVSSCNGYKRAWKQLGFRYVRNNELEAPLFYRISDPWAGPTDALDELGAEDSDDSDSAPSGGSAISDEIDEEMRDFIVPDDEAEQFTRATDDSEYTKFTHESVEKFNSWNPSDASERKVKDFIDHLETKVRTQDDNLRF